MEEPKKLRTNQESGNKAYVAALLLKMPDLFEKIISARHEKLGIPEELARQIAKEVMVEEKREYLNQARPVYKFCFDPYRNGTNNPN